MASSDIRPLIIIGSGPAGLTAAIYAARANLKPLIIEGKNPGGQLMGTTIVENWPGEKSIMGPALMMKMKDHAKQFDCEFLSEEVTSVNFSQRPFTLTTNKAKTFRAHAVIIATGATARQLNCPGEEQYWGKGVSTCAVCDGAFFSNKRVIVVGGGDSAMENASFLHRFTPHITIVHILDKLTASQPMQARILKNPHISIMYNSTITDIKGNGEHPTSVIITNQVTKQQSTHDVDGVFIAIGLTPKTAIFKGQLELDKMGYIVLTQQTKTSIPGVFAAGDVADYCYRQAIGSAGTGCMAALDAERYLKDII